VHQNWLDLSYVTKIVKAALDEDIGAGDITTALTVPAEAAASAEFIAHEAGILAGTPVVAAVFGMIDPSISFSPKTKEGKAFGANDALAVVSGPARGILSAERVALNFLQRLSAIATRTAQFVEFVKGTKARIVDTRKTTPGLRGLEKYAVRVGGGSNHRFGLSDGVLIKDNHIAAAGGVTKAVSAAKSGAPHTLRVEVEVQNLEELNEAIKAGADAVLLDNMPVATIVEAVRIAGGKVILEASGGVTEVTIRQIAETGVDIISIGALTHSIKAIDISLEFLPGGEHWYA
jgi:nicotinate-nucleotide pyrophosphorylase (carboxylating)